MKIQNATYCVHVYKMYKSLLNYFVISTVHISGGGRASLVAQWLRIHPPVQETRVQSLVWEDPTWHGATRPVQLNYWACALEPGNHSCWAHTPQPLKTARLCSATREASAMRNSCTTARERPHSWQLEEHLHINKDPAQLK